MRNKVSIIILFSFSIIFATSDDIYRYKIKFLGIPVATCKVIYSDTIFYNIKSKKLDYRVNTNSLINKIFNINNHYTIIIDQNTYSTLYYKKETSQPNITNSIKTSLINEIVKYEKSDIVIAQNDKNIFTILYLIHTGQYDIIEKIDILEREGKYYNLNFQQKTINKFELLLEERDSKDFGLIKNTDIFLWGLFLEDAKNTIISNEENGYIDKCIFKRGFAKITAKLF